MNNWPTEVIFGIATNLPMSSKLNLAYTFKKLYKFFSETALYSTVAFNNMDQFNQAMQLCQKTDFRQLVRYLYVGDDLDCGIESIISFPALFPGVRYLDWKNDPYDESDIPNPSVFKYCQNLENIVDTLAPSKYQLIYWKQQNVINLQTSKWHFIWWIQVMQRVRK